jgi:hypothetical protein
VVAAAAMERPALERRVTRRKAEENSLAVLVMVGGEESGMLIFLKRCNVCTPWSWKRGEVGVVAASFVSFDGGVSSSSEREGQNKKKRAGATSAFVRG